MSFKRADVCITWPSEEGEQTKWVTIDVREEVVKAAHGDKVKLFAALSKVVHAEHPQHADSHVIDWKGLQRY